MPNLRLPQAYANAFAAQSVRDALASMGEEAILLSTYHLFADLGTQPRCRNFNSVYEQEDHWNCVRCYGTTFEGGIKNFARGWAIFTDHPLDEKYTKTGEWTPDDRSAQLENEPKLLQHDYIVRVQQWDNTHSPVVWGDRYVIDEVQELTLRTGNQYGQNHSVDCYGQQAKIHRLPTNHPIFNYNIPLGVPVMRVDSLPR